MTFQVALPKLRRTLTDIMEDELYHVPDLPATADADMTEPSMYASNTNIDTEMNLYQDYSRALNRISSGSNSPVVSHSGAYWSNTNSINGSQEFLTIPDTMDEDKDQDMTGMMGLQQNDPAQPPLEEDNGEDEDDEFDDDEVIYDYDYEVKPFTAYADRNALSYGYEPFQKVEDYNKNYMLSSFKGFPEKADPQLSFPDDEILGRNPFDFEMNDTSSKLYIYPEEEDKAEINHFDLKKEFLEEDISEDENDDTNRTNNIENNTTSMININPGLAEAGNSVIPPQLLRSSPVISPISNQAQEATGTNSVRSNVSENNTPKQQEIKFKIPSSPSGEEDVHQCQLVNPTTGQKCFKQFSRPYDLIRHQETIHAERKKIFRCILCETDALRHENRVPAYYDGCKFVSVPTESGELARVVLPDQPPRISKKTFSRGDALSRHVRVKHGLTGTSATDAIRYAKDHVEYL
ncbi:Transcription factor [Komagataella phaffii CBS 7435]|uniref:Transcription factor that stimulates expression of proteasome genes n=2 Tax=Komagataella phaffii TaxID=460519 RepID=C4R5A2_KOMPG|nr:uncharacterized protein PAS_chr3_0689 [Komagataella phaffii GS115]AOA64099.1 GQ67_03778T0 [Komagataella phaffii]CAH2449485.1 Transcription factor [Komagataella phaffii CBS 7435]AOA69180.1 GQ68_03750T0 [Komagataella phaffii GS115]CAY70738.1 Transcription factor that stimulates expression of proteasome genes [Komagataella phaffii GS115]CCA39471.1 Transcription factor [Komagataella phaffii CBS 7435]